MFIAGDVLHRQRSSLKNGKPTLTKSRKTGSKNNAKRNFGVNLAKVSDLFGELEQSLFGNQSKMAVAYC